MRQPSGIWADRCRRATSANRDGTERALSLLESPQGSIALGVVAENVIFVCLMGTISPELAARCATQLQNILERGPCFSLYLDAHSLEGGAVAAASEIMRGLGGSRAKLSSVVALARAQFFATPEKLASASDGVPVLETTEPTDFDALLTKAAPLAFAKAAPGSSVKPASSSRPPVSQGTP